MAQLAELSKYILKTLFAVERSQLDVNEDHRPISPQQAKELQADISSTGFNNLVLP